MEQHELLRHLTKCLERWNIPYFITGAMASMAYGEPRLTNDIDVVADLGEDDLPRIATCFPESDFYFDLEAAGAAVRRKLQFNIIHPASGGKIDVIIPKHDAFDESRFRRVRRLQPLDDTEADFASPEDVILKKMEYYLEGKSDKHLRDIAGILKISGESIDKAYLEAWAASLGLLDIWRRILEQIGRGSSG